MLNLVKLLKQAYIKMCFSFFYFFFKFLQWKLLIEAVSLYV